MAGGTTDLVWREQDTSPGAIEAALRGLLNEAHARNESYLPARVMNLVCVVDKEWSGEIANRLRGVGRYHPSRTVVCAVSPGRRTLDAVASIAAPEEAGDGQTIVARELVVVDCGPRHLEHLDRVVDPLVVTDLMTCVWSPHGHPEAVDSLAPVTQIVLIDTGDEYDPRAALARTGELAAGRYVVDLSWLRSTPWRERIAATFDPAVVRPDLRLISRVVVRHHAESAVAALLLVGWMASRLGWQLSPLVAQGGCLCGKAHARKQDVEIVLEPAREQEVRGLAGVELESASGRWLRMDRGPGGLRARYRHRRGVEREWTILGASRGEGGILGEGIRQALLRDPTYAPAVEAARALLG